ncbi:MAG TPA: putative molybdenum carrier protein [Polyangiaceae bacterium]|nr:putative molybdenum carrier protein [Polyangiaceae bacterium]
MNVRKIIAGAQTGAERAALEAARSCKVELGGWVSRRRRADDGRIPSGYLELTETTSKNPAERRSKNVTDSDGTLIVSHGPLRGGFALTRGIADEAGKPCLWLDMSLTSFDVALRQLQAWLERHDIQVLNVAGPRASEDENIHDVVYAMVCAMLRKRWG